MLPNLLQHAVPGRMVVDQLVERAIERQRRPRRPRIMVLIGPAIGPGADLDRLLLAAGECDARRCIRWDDHLNPDRVIYDAPRALREAVGCAMTRAGPGETATRSWTNLQPSVARRRGREAPDGAM